MSHHTARLISLCLLLVTLVTLSAASAGGVLAETTTGPDLAPFAPPAYQHPVVPSSVKNTTQADAVLYAEKPTYFDWHFVNQGDADVAASFLVEVRLDGVKIISQSFAALAGGAWDGGDDWSEVVATPGAHTLTIVVDPENAIAESDEGNNTWSLDFTWSPKPPYWWGEYFNNTDLSGDPVFVSADNEINFDWPDSPGPGVNDDNFSVRWTREIPLNLPSYIVKVSHDDGMRVYVEGELKYNEWGGSVADGFFLLDVSPGRHAVRVEMYDLGGPAAAHFGRQACFTLTTTANPAAGGIIQADPAPDCGAKYSKDTVVSLTAVPNTGYAFNNWSGNLSGSANPQSVTIGPARSVTANFGSNCLALTTAVSPTGGGTISADPTPNCAGGKYTPGTEVCLTANAAVGYTFNNWSGFLSGAQNPKCFDITANRSVTANFNQNCYSLTTAVSPAGGGTISADPAPNCAGGKYTPGTEVCLTANAAAGYTFSNWSGFLSGTQNPKCFDITTNRSVTANFAQGCYSLTTSVSPAGGGTIEATPAPNCDGQYRAGTVVSLRARPAAGYNFAVWSGDMGGSNNPKSLTMSGPRTVVANFSQTCYSLTTSAAPPAGGAVEVTPAANCNGDQYTAGTIVSLRAVPAGAYTFSGWGGDASGSQNPRNLTMNGNRAVVANFDQTCYALTRTIAPPGAGTISANPPPNCGGEYSAGTLVSLTANAAGGWVFANWSGDLSGAQNPTSVTMNGAREVTAHFVETGSDCRRLTLNRTGQGAIPQATPTHSAGCDAGFYLPGETVLLTADPAEGWRVGGWRGTADDRATTTANSLTMPNGDGHTAGVDYVRADGQRRAIVPFILFGPVGFLGPFEAEPNDNSSESNGPLLLNRDYLGFADDENDFFFFDLATPAQLNLTVAGFGGSGRQLHLYYQFTGNRVGYVAAPPYEISYAGQPGRYYVRLFAARDFDLTTPYTLRIGVR